MSDYVDPIQAFISYSHEDEALCIRLEKQLVPLRREGVLSVWYDRRIMGGEDWAHCIDHRISTADLVLPLVSPDFLASDYCWEVEMRTALDRHNRGFTRVVPTILRPSDWERSPLGDLQALPKGGKPITQWADLDAAFLDVGRGIGAVARDLQSKKVRHRRVDAEFAKQSVELRSCHVGPLVVPRGKAIQLMYALENSSSTPITVWLGASLVGGAREYFQVADDLEVILAPGHQTAVRLLTTGQDWTPGNYPLTVGVWFGPKSITERSVRLRSLSAIEIIQIQ